MPTVHIGHQANRMRLYYDTESSEYFQLILTYNHVSSWASVHSVQRELESEASGPFGSLWGRCERRLTRWCSWSGGSKWCGGRAPTKGGFTSSRGNTGAHTACAPHTNRLRHIQRGFALRPIRIRSVSVIKRARVRAQNYQDNYASYVLLIVYYNN